MKISYQLLLRYTTLATFLFCLPYISFAQGNKGTLQPYEILSTNYSGKPTFVDFVTTRINSDQNSVYTFLKDTYHFDENTTFTTYLEKPFFNNGSFIKKQNQYYKGYRVEFSEVVMTYKKNQLLSLAANILPIQDYAPKVSLSEQEALQLALKDMKKNSSYYFKPIKFHF